MNKEDPTDYPGPKKVTVHTEQLKPDRVKSSSTLLSSEPQQHKRVLVVDDNSDIVFTLRVGLESDPTMQVYSYDNPVTALLEFEPNFYDLLLLHAINGRLSISPEFCTEGPQCQGLFYDFWRDKY